MKTVNFLKVTLIAFFSVVLLACDKDDDNMDPVQEKSIVEIVSTNNDFSLLRAAVVHAGLASTLEGAGPFTVFAPTNAAFQKAGLTTEASITALPAETVKNIVLYHALGSRATAESLPTANNTAVKTVQESDIYVTKNNMGVFVNGAMVTQADVSASNGIIHVIDTVLMPASDDLVETLMDDPNFSFLVAAVARASQGELNVIEALKATGPFTVFAPTNQAFMDAGFSTTADIQATNPDTLTSILVGHVLEGRVFSNAVQNDLTVKTIGQNDLVFNISNDAVTVKGEGNTTPSTITSVNKLTTNGVIHVIDSVLLP